MIGDPEQQRDLAGMRPAKDEAGERRIRELVEEALESRPPLVLGVGAQGQQQLEQIGYADGRDSSAAAPVGGPPSGRVRRRR
ncbi:hypothetical protein N9293_01225 [Planctomycetota bacterium]|nr:hypothetical protein [Planctomycetota bacterium]